MPINFNENVITLNDLTIMYWNTERMYTPGGQRIIAVPFSIGDTQDKDVLFIDLDRHIDGIIINCPLDSSRIMQAYDKNEYHPVGNQDEYCLLRDIFAVKDEIIKLF